MTAAHKASAQATHRIAWDRVSFQAPKDWNFAAYSFKKNISRIELEDDYAVRLEAEWTRPRQALDLERIRKRFAKATKQTHDSAVATHPVENLPTGWNAYLYDMPEGLRLVSAFYLAPKSALFCYFNVHFAADDKGNPQRTLRGLTETLTYHDGDIIPWAVYDMSLDLPAAFRLASTTFQAGRKLMIFEWRLRRFYVWLFSLADMLLKEQQPAEWVADFLNSYKGIKGPIFHSRNDGRVHYKRARRYPFGHFEEIGRMCYLYRADFRYDTDRNQILLSVLNYRRHADLMILPSSLQ